MIGYDNDEFETSWVRNDYTHLLLRQFMPDCAICFVFYLKFPNFIVKSQDIQLGIDHAQINITVLNTAQLIMFSFNARLDPQPLSVKTKLLELIT